MAIVFIDGFDYNAAATEKYNTATAVGYTTSSPSPRTGSRSLRLNTNLTAATLTKTLDSSYTSMSIAFGLYASSTFGTTDNISLNDSSGGRQLTLRFESNGIPKLYRGTPTANLLGTASSGLSTGVWQHVELVVTIDDSAGAADLYINGVNVLALSGIDTKATAVAGAKTISLQNVSGNSNALYVDDLVMTDQYAQTGSAIVQTLYPTGAGATTQWTPSAGANYAAVDETPGDGDTTYVSTSTLNQVDTYGYGNLASNSGAVLGVAVNAVGRADAGGSPQVAPVVRPGSTDYVGTGKVMVAGYSNAQHVWSTNPDGGDWTESAVNALEAGIKKTV
jgi:hypothetical protein